MPVPGSPVQLVWPGKSKATEVTALFTTALYWGASWFQARTTNCAPSLRAATITVNRWPSRTCS
jgi:hypothetical protein